MSDKPTEVRDFPTAVIASLATGTLFCDFSAMHEAAEFLMGHPIWTHQFADNKLRADMQKTVLEQCLDMPTTAEGVTKENYQEFAAKMEAELGKTLCIQKGSGRETT